MNKRTKIALLFLGNLLLLIGFFFLPLYVLPYNNHGNLLNGLSAWNLLNGPSAWNLLNGPSAWNLMTFPFVTQPSPQLGAFLVTLPFWLLAALILFEVGGEMWKLWRHQRIAPHRLYNNIGQIGLLWMGIIFILSWLNYVQIGWWRSILINVSGLGFWSCIIGFLLIGVTRLPLRGMQRVSTHDHA